MRWDDFRQSENVEDRRGSGGDDGGFGGGGGGFPMPGGRGGLGIGTILILGLVGWVVGIDPRQLIGMVQDIQGGGGQFERGASPARNPANAPTRPATATSASCAPSSATPRTCGRWCCPSR
jgi:predicted metalloprotease